MNLWLELLFVLVRAALISLGTLMVQRGWIAEETAQQFADPAAAWLAAGLFVIGVALGQSAWSKIKTAAAARLALMFPAGSPWHFVASAMREITKAALWRLARGTRGRRAEDNEHLYDAATAVRHVLVEHGYRDLLETDDEKSH